MRRARQKTSLALSAAALLALAGAASATKLDLLSNVELKAANYQRLVYGSGSDSQPLFSEDATLGFIIKDIRLEKTQDSTMDVGIVLQSIGQGASTAPITTPQFKDAAALLPSTDGTPYIRNAYVRIHHFLKPNITATFGRQDFTLGQGITLSGDDLGLPGGRLEASNVLGKLKADLFVFRPFKTDHYYTITGGAAYCPTGEGIWEFYHFWQNDKAPAQDLNFDTLSRTKKFTGVRYFLTRSNLSFDGEAAIERGTSERSGGGTGNYKGEAFMLKGSWTQDIAFFGESRLRLAYGRSSGGTSWNAADKAFFPDFGSRYSGLERSGYGAIAGASLYDMIKTSSTLNGLPYGVSGLNIIDIGADLPYKKLVLSADLYKFRASENDNNGSLQIASEWDLKAAYPMGDDLRLTVVYAVLTPLGLYNDAPPSKLVYGAVSAKF